MQELKSKWENVRTRLWFLPSILVVLAIAASFLMLNVDRSFTISAEGRFWLFNGTPDAARTMLATIGAAVITVVSIAFSLTILAIQSAATQYTPRVLRTFTSNIGNQVVLGMYIATFVYSLLILRAVRDPNTAGNNAFVPFLAVSLAILLAVVCMGLLVYFISHIAQSLQASAIIKRVYDGLMQQLRGLYPNEYEEGAEAAQPKTHRSGVRKPRRVKVHKTGYISRIDENILGGINHKEVSSVEVLLGLGSFVTEEDTVAYIWGKDEDALQEVESQVRSALVIADQRSSDQDPLFVIRQLVDIAIKALSSGINDQTTAEYCIYYLGSALSFMAGRSFTSQTLSDTDGNTVVRVSKANWEEYVLNSFSQIRNEAKTKPHVLHVMLSTLHKLAHHLPSQHRVPAVKLVLLGIAEEVDRQQLTAQDKALLRYEIKQVRRSLSAVR